MAAKGIPTLIAGFFNTGTESSVGGFFTKADGERIELSPGVPSKRPLRDFAEETKALTPDEKLWFAEMICAVTGDTIKAS